MQSTLCAEKSCRCAAEDQTQPSRRQPHAFFAVQLAQKIAKELEAGTGNYPFEKIVWCNIGNPQILGQKPITYFRQVLALCEYPQVGRRRPAESPHAIGHMAASAMLHGDGLPAHAWHL